MKSETVTEQSDNSESKRLQTEAQPETQTLKATEKTAWKEPKMYAGAAGGAAVALLFRRVLLHDMFHNIAASSSMMSSLALFSVIGGAVGAAVLLEDRRMQAALIGLYQGVISFAPVMYDVFTEGAAISPFSFQFDQGFLLLPIVAYFMITTAAAGAVGGYLGSIFASKSTLTSDDSEDGD